MVPLWLIIGWLCVGAVCAVICLSCLEKETGSEHGKDVRLTSFAIAVIGSFLIGPIVAWLILMFMMAVGAALQGWQYEDEVDEEYAKAVPDESDIETWLGGLVLGLAISLIGWLRADTERVTVTEEAAETREIPNATYRTAAIATTTTVETRKVSEMTTLRRRRIAKRAAMLAALVFATLVGLAWLLFGVTDSHSTIATYGNAAWVPSLTVNRFMDIPLVALVAYSLATFLTNPNTKPALDWQRSKVDVEIKSGHTFGTAVGITFGLIGLVAEPFMTLFLCLMATFSFVALAIFILFAANLRRASCYLLSALASTYLVTALLCGLTISLPFTLLGCGAVLILSLILPEP